MLLAIFLSACSVNPVTGEKELTLVSEAEEIQIGQEAYDPLRQSQGGDYVADEALLAYVNEVGKKLAAVSERRLDYEFSVVNSPVVNAWALPGGKISINRGLLLELENEAELAAVLGHEVVHAAARHGAQSLTRGRLLDLTSTALVLAADNGGYSDKAEVIGGTAILAGNLVNLQYGRDAEREADHYGMIYMSRAGYDTRAAISLQEKFVRLSKSADVGWFSELVASHPPSQERVDNNRELAKSLGEGGDLGEARYQQAIAHLVSVKPAYLAYRKGQEALDSGDLDVARTQATKAISIEPREGIFHVLLGDVLTRQGREKSALLSYHRASELSPRYYVVFEKRGLLNCKLGDEQSCHSDMQIASSLLPTAVSFLALGEIAEGRGNPQQAMQYYRSAASADSPSGKRAARKYARLDRHQNPQNYLRGKVALDEQGVLIVIISNPLDEPVGDVRFTLATEDGETVERYRFAQTIDKGEAVTLKIGSEPLKLKKFKKMAYEVSIDTARIVSP